MPKMVDTKEKLFDLIEYVDKLIKIGERPVFSLKKYTAHTASRNRAGQFQYTAVHWVF